MGRAIGAVVAGAAVWAVLWLGMNAVLPSAIPDVYTMGEPLESVPVLLFLIAYSVGLSLLAGFVTAIVRGGSDPMPAVKALAVLQLILGIVAEVSNWALLPVWYHLVFLALIVPATVYGGMLRARRSATG